MSEKRTKTKIRFLTELPKKNGDQLDYDEMIGAKLKIVVSYEDSTYIIIFLRRNPKNQKQKYTFRIKCLETGSEKDIASSDFICGYFCDILGKISLFHKHEPGEVIKTKLGKIKIFDQTIHVRTDGHRERSYMYKCLVCNRIGYITENALEEGHGCAVCANQMVVKGKNDFWTTAPEVAKMLANPEQGYEYTSKSNIKLDWICPKCGALVSGKRIGEVTRNGLFCENCSDGLSLPERIVYEILKSLKIDFEYNKKKSWSNNKRYDFIIPSLKCIIETHGGQHYREKTFTHRSLEEEKDNDRIKTEMAQKNGHNNYIVIECNHSDFDYVKNSIMQNEQFLKTFNTEQLNWQDIRRKSLTSLKLQAIEQYNQRVKIKDISLYLKVHKETVKQYLKDGTKAGLCNYENRADKTANNMMRSKGLFLSGKSVPEIAKEVGSDESTIVRYLKELTQRGECDYKTPFEIKAKNLSRVKELILAGKTATEIIGMLGLEKSLVYSLIREVEEKDGLKYTRKQDIVEQNKQKVKKLLREGFTPHKAAKTLSLNPQLTYKCVEELDAEGFKCNYGPQKKNR